MQVLAVHPYGHDTVVLPIYLQHEKLTIYRESHPEFDFVYTKYGRQHINIFPKEDTVGK